KILARRDRRHFRARARPPRAPAHPKNDRDRSRREPRRVLSHRPRPHLVGRHSECSRRAGREPTARHVHAHRVLADPLATSKRHPPAQQTHTPPPPPDAHANPTPLPVPPSETGPASTKPTPNRIGSK